MKKSGKDENKAIGGRARASSLSTDRKREIAEKAALTRWGMKILRKGNFQEQFGIDIDCYVLDDKQKTAVISKRGMAEAIGFSRRANSFVGFVNSQNMEKYIGRELKEKVSQPIVIQRFSAAAAKSATNETHGFDATILIDVCKSILDASRDGKLLGSRYKKMIEQAQIIISASAKSGIKSLVYAISGYNPTAQEVIDAFKAYIQEEARKYEPEFPNDIYMQWYKLYKIEVPQRGKPWQFKHLTVKHIYYPLAKSNGKIYELVKALKAKGGDRQKKLFQFLNEVGVRALRIHIGRILEMSESSIDQAAYEEKIRKRFGDQQELELIIPSDPPISS